jgi:hypothetical protein
MAKREIKTKEDLAKYLPDAAAIEEAMRESIDYGKEVDPALVEKLQHMKTDPGILRPAPPSETAYVPPTTLPGSAQDDEPTMRAERKVELKVPRMSDAPTAPSLKRLEGEPEVPGVVKGPSAYAPKGTRAAAKDAQRISTRTAVLATLAFASAALVLVAMARIMRQPAPPEAGSARMAMEPAAPVPSVAATAAQTATAAQPSAALSASAVPSASASAGPAASPPTVGPHKTKPHATLDDPYGEASAPSPPTTAALSATPKTVPSAVPTAVPSVTRPPAPPAPPSASTPAPWFTP